MGSPAAAGGPWQTLFRAVVLTAGGERGHRAHAKPVPRPSLMPPL